MHNQDPHRRPTHQDSDDDRPRDQIPTIVWEKLFTARTVLLSGTIDMRLARNVMAQLLALAAESNDDITLYINSPGGHVEAGDTIHDMLTFVKPRVKVVGTGWVASAGAHIYLAVPRHDRFSLPNTRFLLHQPSGGAGGWASDIDIEAREILKMRDRLNQVIARQTGQPLEKVQKDTDRNFWLSAEEAIAYGIVGKIIASVKEL